MILVWLQTIAGVITCIALLSFLHWVYKIIETISIKLALIRVDIFEIHKKLHNLEALMEIDAKRNSNRAA